MYSIEKQCEGVAVGLEVRPPHVINLFRYNQFFPESVERRVHVYAAPDGRLAYTTSPERTGISWLIGSADSLEQLAAEYPCSARDHFSERYTLVWVPGAPAPAKIIFWDQEMQDAFAVGLAASGGIAYMVNKHRGAHLVDDTPDPEAKVPTPETPGVIVGQLAPQIIRGPAWREDVPLIPLMPDAWLARRVRWAQGILGDFSKNYINPETALGWAQELLAEWERRGLDLGEFAKVEVFHLYGDPTKAVGVKLLEPGAHSPEYFGGLGRPSLPKAVIDAANAVCRGTGPVAALRQALRKAELYR